ncbi:SLC13 family permease, partial [Solidesulfovibrio aerotolerans]|uniref:SLC13 family permease n=1 Tax=Solidesulfovibrio aerotolerans TaxID=295255 RepID=UPI001FE2DAE9
CQGGVRPSPRAKISSVRILSLREGRYPSPEDKVNSISSVEEPYIAGLLVDLEGMQLIWIIACIVALNIFLTEVTSNTAVATLMIPVMGAIAVGMKINPLGPIVAACIACSYAFMLPVATPPNAVVFGSGAVTIRQMARTGLWLNILGIIQITLVVYFLMPWAWGVDLSVLPDWAIPKK